MGQHGSHRLEHAAEVHVDYVLPLLVRHVHDAARAGDSGIRDENIEPAEFRERRRNGCVKLVCRAHVHGTGDCAPPALLDQPSTLGEVVRSRERLQYGDELAIGRVALRLEQ